MLFFFQAEDGIRDLVRSRGLGDVYKRQVKKRAAVMKDLKNKVIAITGAASGIGESLAMQLADLGCHLALADIDEKGLAETVSKLAPGNHVSTHIVDVSDKNRVHQWADEVVAEHGHVDILINNAGVASTARIDEISYEDFDWVFGIVFYGVLYGTKAFLPHLKTRPDANIVNISSVNGFFPFPTNGPYNAAKHAVKALNQTLIQELRNSNISVTSVHPGGVKTNIVRNARLEKGAFGQKEQIEGFDKLVGTSASQAARIIIKGMRKNKKRLLVGTDAVIIDLLVRLFPQGFSDLVGILFGLLERRYKSSLLSKQET